MRLFGARALRLPSGQLSRNTSFSAGQGVVGMICMFIAYRILIDSVGLERMGLFSLMMAAVSVARLADVTGAGMLAKFVAEARASDRDAGIYVHTVILFTIALYAVIAAIVYVFADKIILMVIDPEWLQEATSIAPIVIMGGLLFTPVGGALSSAIDGLRRADIRSSLIIGSYLLFLAIVILAVPIYGLYAWGIALIVQQLFIIVGAWMILQRRISGLGFLPTRWSRAVFQETMPLGLKLQINNLANTLSEPLAKFLLQRFGGLAAVAIYELATKLVFSGRGLIAQACQPVMPEFASENPGSAHFNSLLKRAFKTVSRATVAFFVVILLVMIPFSFFARNVIDWDLIQIILILAIGSAINLLSVPYYFAGAGSNVMLWNIGSQFVVAGSVIVIGTILGSMIGTIGVVWSIAIGLSAGSVMVILGNRHAFKSF
jgi:O-antigen/teichoic acid export membrane protein